MKHLNRNLATFPGLHSFYSDPKIFFIPTWKIEDTPEGLLFKPTRIHDGGMVFIRALVEFAKSMNSPYIDETYTFEPANG